MTLSRINHTGAAAGTTLNGSITALDTTLSLSGTVSGYPTADFVIKIDAGTSSEEKILVGSRSGATCSSLTRAYDDTSATSHSSGAAVEHDLAAKVIDDANDHIYTTTRDDHTQYAKADGTRAFTGGITVDSGGADVTGNSTVTGTLAVTGAATLESTVAVTGAATLSSTLAVTGAVTGSSTVQGTALAATLAGDGRYVGTTDGAPSTGTFLTGDFANDPTNGVFWVCTAGGTPGTWLQIEGGSTDASWTDLTAENDWSITGSTGFFNGGYRLVNGRVQLRGVAKSGVVDTTIATLPTGYRPSKKVFLYLNAENSSAAFGVCELDIQTDGAIIPISFSNGTLDTIPLDNISFDLL